MHRITIIIISISISISIKRNSANIPVQAGSWNHCAHHVPATNCMRVNNRDESNRNISDGCKTAKKRACDILHLMGKVCWAEGRQGLSPHNIEQQLRVRDAGITAAAAAAFTVPAKSIDYTLTSVIR